MVCQDTGVESGWTRGKITIRRLTPTVTDPPFPLSADPELDRMLRDEIGPDSFYSALYGPEIHDLGIPTYAKPVADRIGGTMVTYSLNFKLETNGVYRLNIYLTGTEFVAVEERTETERGYLMKMLFTVELTVTGGKAWAESVRSHDISHQQRGEEKGGRANDHNEARSGEQVCDELQGKWMYGPFVSGPTWTAECMPDCLSKLDVAYHVKGRYEEASTFGPVTGLQWVPFKRCVGGGVGRFLDVSGTKGKNGQQGSGVSLVEECLRGKYLLFAGDGHMRRMEGRLLTANLAHPAFQACPPPDYTQDIRCVCQNCAQGCDVRYGDGDGGSDGGDGGGGGGGGEILGDPDISCTVTRFLDSTSPNNVGGDDFWYKLEFLESKFGMTEASVKWLRANPPLNSRGLRNPDVLFLSFGHWATNDRAHGGQKSLSYFKEALRKSIESVRRAFDDPSQGKTRTKLIWVSLTPISPSRKANLKWSSHYRIILMNRVAEKIMGEVGGFEILRIHEVFSPLFKTAGRHFNTFHQDPVLSQVLRQLCPAL